MVFFLMSGLGSRLVTSCTHFARKEVKKRNLPIVKIEFIATARLINTAMGQKALGFLKGTIVICAADPWTVKRWPA